MPSATILTLLAAQAMTITPPAPPASAPSDTATLLSRYHDLTSATPGGNCDHPAGSDIVVCAKRSSNQRLPLPDERDTTPVGPSPEPDRAEAMCEASSGRPCTVCPPTGCTGVNFLAAPFKLFRIVRAIVDPEH